jgi:hypothetical protein
MKAHYCGAANRFQPDPDNSPATLSLSNRNYFDIRGQKGVALCVTSRHSDIDFIRQRGKADTVFTFERAWH